MSDDRKNILEFIDSALTKVPFQIYVFAGCLALMFVAVSVYDYTHPSQEVQDLIGLKQMQDELFDTYSAEMINCEPAVLSAHFPVNGQAVVTEVEPSKCYEVNN